MKGALRGSALKVTPNTQQVHKTGQDFLPAKSRALTVKEAERVFIVEAFLPGSSMSLRVKVGSLTLLLSPLRVASSAAVCIAFKFCDGFLPYPIAYTNIVVVAFEVLRIKGTVLRGSASFLQPGCGIFQDRPVPWYCGRLSSCPGREQRTLGWAFPSVLCSLSGQGHRLDPRLVSVLGGGIAE